nr:MAG TPA: hypothetical protein [Inoviridae sp.]
MRLCSLGMFAASSQVNFKRRYLYMPLFYYLS